jgi:heparin/heparan-sulfate lyase
MHIVRGAATALLFIAALPAQTLEGDWSGADPRDPGAFPMMVRIAKAPTGEWRGVLNAPDLGVNNLQIPSISLSGAAVKFEVAGFNATFEGKFSFNEIVGQWTRLGNTRPFVFRRGVAAAATTQSLDLRRYQAIVTDPAKWMDDDGVQVPIPPAEHPRLYLRARDLDDLHRRVDHPVLKPTWNAMQKSENPQVRLEVDAVRYLLTHDTELAKRTAAAAVDTLEHASYDKNVQDISRAIGRMMVTGAIVYDWCYPVLTREQKDRIIAQEVRLAKEMESGYPPYDGGYLSSHGSEWMIMRDMLSAGVAIYDEFPEMYRFAANRFFKGSLPGRNFWYEGHAFHQGSAYAETRISSELYPLWIFDRMGFSNIYNPAQQFVPYSWIYMRRPDGQLLRSGDGQSRRPELRDLLIASYYGDGYILGDYLRDPGVGSMNRIYELLWRDPDLKPLPVTDLPLARYMGSPFGWMVARTGWDADAVIAEMKVNVYNFVNHQHLDGGAFQIYYHGPLAIDSGLYEQANGDYGSAHHLNYYQRTIAHNSLLIYDPNEKFPSNRGEMRNDGGQQRPNRGREASRLEDLLTRGYHTGEVLAHDIGANYTYLKGDITAAYSAKVREVKRSFVFLNSPGIPAALIVFDKVVSADPSFRKYWLLHSMEEPEIRGNSAVVSLSQRGWTGRLIDTALLPEAVSIEKVGGPGKEFWVFGENFPNQLSPGSDPKEFEIGAWRIELSPRAASATDYFLNVMEIVDGKTANVPSVDRLTAKDLTGARIADRVVCFQKESGRIVRPVSFAVSGAGTLRYLMTDLAEGTWQVWRDGRIVMPAATVREFGTLYFEGPPGSYELRR